MTARESSGELKYKESQTKDDVTIATENITKKRLKREEQVLEKATADLSIFYKALCFIIFIRRFKGISLFKLDSDSILKRQQSNYYGVTGFSFFITGILLTSNFNVPFLLAWCAGFGLSYLFDILYNRQRQIDDIKGDWPRSPYKLY
ncbi:MAG: hypothetical protein V4577_17895 [Bacteroidota bacterium]